MKQINVSDTFVVGGIITEEQADKILGCMYGGKEHPYAKEKRKMLNDAKLIIKCPLNIAEHLRQQWKHGFSKPVERMVFNYRLTIEQLQKEIIALKNTE